MPRALTLSTEAHAVLRESTITADRAVLPARQLDRALYAEVNKALEGAGGKWNRSTKAHLFTQDPRPLLGLAVETGVATQERSERAVQVERQAFYTPAPLARILANLADVAVGEHALEPSAGHGAIAEAVLEASGVLMHCVELDEGAATALRKKGFPCMQADFLTVELAERPDVVVVNPPFTRGTDIKHVMRAYRCVRPGGRVIAIMSGGTPDAVSKVAKELHALYPMWVPVADEAFKESGTLVKTVICVISKPAGA